MTVSIKISHTSDNNNDNSFMGWGFPRHMFPKSFMIKELGIRGTNIGF